MFQVTTMAPLHGCKVYIVKSVTTFDLLYLQGQKPKQLIFKDRVKAQNHLQAHPEYHLTESYAIWESDDECNPLIVNHEQAVFGD